MRACMHACEARLTSFDARTTRCSSLNRLPLRTPVSRMPQESIPILELVREMGAIMQEFTQSGGVRPFGVSLLIAGCVFRVSTRGLLLTQAVVARQWGLESSRCACGSQAVGTCALGLSFPGAPACTHAARSRCLGSA